MHETEAPFVESADERAKREQTEADAMHRFPGVEFWWSNGERRAKLKDSGIEGWETIRALQDLDWDIDRLADLWPDVGRSDIADMLRYYRECPSTIDERSARDDAYERAHFAALAEERERYSV